MSRLDCFSFDSFSSTLIDGVDLEVLLSPILVVGERIAVIGDSALGRDWLEVSIVTGGRRCAITSGPKLNWSNSLVIFRGISTLWSLLLGPWLLSVLGRSRLLFWLSFLVEGFGRKLDVLCALPVFTISTPPFITTGSSRLARKESIGGFLSAAAPAALPQLPGGVETVVWAFVGAVGIEPLLELLFRTGLLNWE